MGVPSEEQYGSSAELVRMHMVGCEMLCEEQLQDLSLEKQKLYLAFELGVLEYHHRTMLTLDKSEDPNNIFFEFLIFYSNMKYQSDSLPILDFWQGLALQSLMHEERKLGFESVSNYVNSDGRRNQGHAPPIYFMKALRISF